MNVGTCPANQSIRMSSYRVVEENHTRKSTARAQFSCESEPPHIRSMLESVYTVVVFVLRLLGLLVSRGRL